MADEKRTVYDYEVLFTMYVGSREVVMLFDPKSSETPYMVGYCESNPDIGTEHLLEVVGSDDYLEAVDEFLCRVQSQVAQVRTDRERTNEPQEVLGQKHCLLGGMEKNLNGCVVVLRPGTLRPEYRNAANQLIYVTGGFGAAPNSRGSAMFGNNVFSGENAKCRRHDIIGVLDPAKAPDWVKPSIDAIHAQQSEKRKDDRGNRG